MGVISAKQDWDVSRSPSSEPQFTKFISEDIESFTNLQEYGPEDTRRQNATRGWQKKSENLSNWVGI